MVREMAKFKAAVCTVTGRRSKNEDNYYFNGRIEPRTHGDGRLSGDFEGGAFFGVFDGMGGERDGEAASYMGARSLGRAVKKGGEAADVMDRAVQLAGNAMLRRTRARFVMGCTAVMLHIGESMATLASLGDSRAYMMRDGALRCLTRDHTEARLMIDAGIIGEGDAWKSEGRNRLTRFMGKSIVAERCGTLELMPGDVFLLCTDGVWAPLMEPQLAAALAASDSADTAEKITAMAKTAGSRDNMTAVVIMIDK